MKDLQQKRGTKINPDCRADVCISMSTKWEGLLCTTIRLTRSAGSSLAAHRKGPRASALSALAVSRKAVFEDLTMEKPTSFLFGVQNVLQK